MTATKYVDAPNRRVDVGGTPFAYRELGTASAVPMIDRAGPIDPFAQHRLAGKESLTPCLLCHCSIVILP